MKAAIAAIVFVFVLLFVVTTFYPSAGAQERAAQEAFTAEEIETGLQLALERKLISWTFTFVALAFLLVLVFSGWMRPLTDRVNRWTGGRWWLTVLVIGGGCYVAQRVVIFPLQVVSLEHWRAWGMTSQSFADWLADYGKAAALNVGLGAVLLVGFYGLLRWFPRTWWLLATGLGAVVGVVYAVVMPIWIDPLFNTFTPLDEVDRSLNEKIMALAARSDVPVQEVLVVDASRQGSHTNAYFTGFGPTRRIVLYDTLLTAHAGHPEEILSIMGHEIGHWKHNHILKGIGLAVAGAMCGFFLLSLALWWAVGRRPFNLTGPADPAGWPLILLLWMLANWVSMPVENAVSRVFERQADMAALELTHDPRAFIGAEMQMARKNKSNVAPNPVSFWFFSTHPSTLDRIEMARDWQAQH